MPIPTRRWRPVRRRAVRAKRMVQREAASGHRHHHPAALVELLDDRLAAAIDAVVEAERGVMHLARRAPRRHHLHAAGLGAGVAQRDPGGDVLVRIEAEIGRVLVPRGKGRALRLLDEEGRGIDQDVGPDHALDRVEDPRMTRQPVEPRQEHIGGGAPAPVAHIDRLAEPRLIAGKPLAAFAELGLGQGRMRKRIAVVPITRDLVWAEHQCLPLGAAAKRTAAEVGSRCLSSPRGAGAAGVIRLPQSGNRTGNQLFVQIICRTRGYTSRAQRRPLNTP